ncbi:hypothetical protein BC628DRAFT_1366334 [Trametes gibbosa]|nr:hypothetical protein BC628DRAFT_1366334 [Trametes gibbosa]
MSAAATATADALRTSAQHQHESESEPSSETDGAVGVGCGCRGCAGRRTRAGARLPVHTRPDLPARVAVLRCCGVAGRGRGRTERRAEGERGRENGEWRVHSVYRDRANVNVSVKASARGLEHRASLALPKRSAPRARAEGGETRHQSRWAACAASVSSRTAEDARLCVFRDAEALQMHTSKHLGLGLVSGCRLRAAGATPDSGLRTRGLGGGREEEEEVVVEDVEEVLDARSPCMSYAPVVVDEGGSIHRV